MIFAFLGTQEIIIILVIALLVFGPQKLPEIGKQVGSALRELNRMRGDVQKAFDLDELTRDHSTSYTAAPPYNSSAYDTTYHSTDHTYDSSTHQLESADLSVAAADHDHGVGMYETGKDVSGWAVTGELSTATPPHTVPVSTAAALFAPPPGPAAYQAATTTLTTEPVESVH